VVDFRDRWGGFAEVLDPCEVLPVPTRLSSSASHGDETEWPPLVDENGELISPEVAGACERALEASLAAAAAAEEDDEADVVEAPVDPMLVEVSLAGYYRLPDRCIPVFDHQREPFEQLITAAASGDRLTGVPLRSFFDDGPPPYPSNRALRDLVAHVREVDIAPDLVAVTARAGPTDVVDEIFEAGPIDQRTQANMIQLRYQRSLARSAYPTLAHFEESVDQEIRRRLHPAGAFDPEAPVGQLRRAKRPILPRFERSLVYSERLMSERAEELLPGSIFSRWGEWPRAEWTRHVVAYAFAHWSVSQSSRTPGRQRIRVNRLLRTDPSIVSDEVLAFLLYHELLHCLLPGQGHDAQFRELEARWPCALEHDKLLDTLHEQYDTRPESYRFSQ
jgi:hypothetical protein